MKFGIANISTQRINIDTEYNWTQDQALRNTRKDILKNQKSSQHGRHIGTYRPDNLKTNQ